jgi:hypothetical protein
MTLTHGCNNAFADSGGIFTLPEPKWGGLSYVPFLHLRDYIEIAEISDTDTQSPGQGASQRDEPTRRPH